MNILITNDDGWGAKGLLTLIDTMRLLGDVTVVAPDGPRSGQSNAISVLTPLRLKKVQEEPGLRVYLTNGTPTDCIKLGIFALFPDAKPDLVVSGINHGDNGMVNVIYSGTMGAVFEGCARGIPSIGFSLCDHDPDADFSFFQPHVLRLTKAILALPQRDCMCWNINCPVGPVKGARLTRHCHGYWDKEYIAYEDPTGKPFYMLTGHFVNTELEATDTDQYANAHGYISVTPTSIDMTDYAWTKSTNTGLEY
ncbi:MAG: 5'/3'-nucleotidase SurE [Paludibacteraceae bacterium]|nr:5'/3'-nucleotidase SurE [Paludibacteraceae bacterium]